MPCTRNPVITSGLFHGLGDGVAQLARRWRAGVPGRRHQPEPADRLVFRLSGLAHGRDIGKRRRPRVAAHRQRLDRSGLDERHHPGHRSEIELGVVRHGGGHRRRAALVRHMDGVILDAGERDEHGDGEMAGRAGAAGRVVELARLRLGERDQVGDIGDRQRRVHHQHVLHQREQRDRLEVLDRIVAELGRSPPARTNAWRPSPRAACSRRAPRARPLPRRSCRRRRRGCR